MESAKEKAIREAYGEHWEHFKDNVDSDGWIKDRDFWGNWPENLKSIKWQTTDHDNDYYDTRRPMILKGIETNNGWTRIESEADLPNEDGYYEVCKDGVPQKNKSYYHSKFSGFKVSRGSKQITHWKTPIEVNPPIY